jgi:hypothetical protein
MSWHSIEVVKPLLEALLFICAVGFSALRKRGTRGRRELPEPSAGRFWLSLFGAIVCGVIAVGSFRYIQDHQGDYINLLMIFSALFGALFAAGLLLRAFLEGLRVLFPGDRR